MPRGDFGYGFRGGSGRGGMRRRGMPLIVPMGGWDMGSPLATTLVAGGLGYLMGSNAAQHTIPPQSVVVAPPYSPYPTPDTTAASSEPASSTTSGQLAQLTQLSKLYRDGFLTEEEFAKEKQRILLQ
jgi:hypothetical protein